MKKPFDFRVLSVMICIDCGKNLKMNLVVRKPTAERCYKCYKIYKS